MVIFNGNLFQCLNVELTEIVNQEIIFMKTTTEWVVGYKIRPFGD